MKRVLTVISTVAALLAVPTLASAEQPMFRPLDGTWDAAQVQEWLTEKSVKKGLIGVQEEAHSTDSTGQIGGKTKKAGQMPQGHVPTVAYPPVGADR